jgi:hypothetical protein
MSESEFVVTNSPPNESREIINANSTMLEASTEVRLASTAKKDVVEAIYEIEDKGQSSKFLIGHISTEKLKDTFLIEEE